MSNHTHIQRIEMRRCTVVAALAATTLGLTATVLPSTAGHDGGTQNQARVHPMPNGGCTSGGCRRVSAS